jgi:hypothetical protein
MLRWAAELPLVADKFHITIIRCHSVRRSKDRRTAWRWLLAFALLESENG